MKTKSTHSEIPSLREMAAGLLQASSGMIFDHYACTQGRRVRKLMKSDPTALLAELLDAVRQFNMTQVAMARAAGAEWNELADHQKSELMSEAYQSLYRAVYTPASDEMSGAQVRKFKDWIRSIANGQMEMTILFLHGKESIPGGKKPTYLAKQGFTVLNPKLPADDFDEAVRIAQAEFDKHRPDVVVGSSRGGAVAMNINSGDGRLIVLCPAYRKWGAATTVKPGTVILHSRTDELIPFSDSEDLVRNSGLPGWALKEIGSDHQLSTPEPLEAMVQAVLKK